MSYDSFECAGPDAVQEARLLTLVCYPNPFEGAFTLLLADQASTSAVVSVFDVLGRMVWRDKVPVRAGELSLNAASLSSGTYSIIAEMDGRLSGPLVVVRR